MFLRNGTLALRLGLSLAVMGAVKGWHDYPMVVARYDVCVDDDSRPLESAALEADVMRSDTASGSTGTARSPGGGRIDSGVLRED
jgi:hypothetical protein